MSNGDSRGCYERVRVRGDMVRVGLGDILK